MDNNELLQLRQLATGSLIKYADNDEVYRLAQALETACEGVESFDEMVERIGALEEDNDSLRENVNELVSDIRDIYRVTKSANSSDVKRLTEIQEICEEADVDLSKIV